MSGDRPFLRGRKSSTDWGKALRFQRVTVRVNALFDAHLDDPEFGYRYLVEGARAAGEPMAERTAWRICSTHRLWSVFGKERGKNGKVGPPVHDDLVERDFSAESPNQLWLSGITEHPTREGKLYCV